jgi:hypothetical protein
MSSERAIVEISHQHTISLSTEGPYQGFSLIYDVLSKTAKASFYIEMTGTEIELHADDVEAWLKEVRETIDD